MAEEVKISGLPVAPNVNPTDQLEANQAGTSRSITLAQVYAAAAAGVDLSSYAKLASPVFTGDPKAPTPAPGDNDTSIATTAFTTAAISTAIAGVSVTVPAGSVAYGGVGGAITGTLANFSWDNTNKRLGIGLGAPTAAVDVVAQANTQAIKMSGYSLTGSNATGCFSIAAALNTTGQPDIFAINITDTSNSGGNAFAIRGGPSGTNTLIRTSMSGDTRVGGWCQARINDALVTNGADYFAYYLGNGSGGNIGLFAGLSNPTFSTFGRYGSIYLNGASPGLPYYNNNGTTGWDRLVGEASTQTLTNKTFAPTSISPGSNGQVLTTVSGAAAWAANAGGPPSGTAGGVLAGTYPNPTAGPGILRLYDEQVLAATATEIRVTIPANAKKVEIEYFIGNNAAADFILVMQAMQGASAYAGATYSAQLVTFSGATTSPSFGGGGTFWNLGTTQNFTGIASLRNISTGWYGNLQEYAISSGSTVYNYSAAMRCDVTANTITGFRLISSGGATVFAIGSFVRCFVVT